MAFQPGVLGRGWARGCHVGGNVGGTWVGSGWCVGGAWVARGWHVGGTGLLELHQHLLVKQMFTTSERSPEAARVLSPEDETWPARCFTQICIIKSSSASLNPHSSVVHVTDEVVRTMKVSPLGFMVTESF